MPSFQNDGADAYKPGLERIQEFCRKIGNPQKNYFTIHVAGTNGKGSVSHMLASVLQQAGYRVGLFTSPHLTDFRERIKVDGEMVPKQKVVNFIDKYRPDIESLGMSFFEVTAALAFDYFAQSDVEVAVIETGLGGRLDATNIIIPIVSVITNIGLEHTEFLGDTLPKIAREKGGIIKKSRPVVLGEKNPNYNLVIEEIAQDLHSEVIYAENKMKFIDQQLEEDFQVITIMRQRDQQKYVIRLDLMGEYQRQNLQVLCAVADYLHEKTPLSISRRALIDGLKDVCQNTGFTGRWQIIQRNPMVVCDTGHNAHGLKYVAGQLSRRTNPGKLFCLMGFCADKDVDEILGMMPSDAHYIFTKANIKRAASLEDVALLAQAHGLDYELEEDVLTALDKAKAMLAPEDMLFIGGSSYIVAEVL